LELGQPVCEIRGAVGGGLVSGGAGLDQLLGIARQILDPVLETIERVIEGAPSELARSRITRFMLIRPRLAGKDGLVNFMRDRALGDVRPAFGCGLLIDVSISDAAAQHAVTTEPVSDRVPRSILRPCAIETGLRLAIVDRHNLAGHAAAPEIVLIGGAGGFCNIGHLS
jgi:hypothetical protein